MLRRRIASFLGVQLLVIALIAPPALGSAGDLDPTFSDDGIVKVRFAGMATEIAAVEPVPHHGFLAAANVGCCGGQDIAIAHVHPDGTQDAAFGDNGLAGLDTGETDRVIWMGRDPEGRILIVGYRQLFGDGCAFEVCINLLLARLRPGGSPDPTFGEDGVVTIDSAFDRSPIDAAIDGDGRVLVVARFERADQTHRAVVVRFLGDGSFDPSFGEGGVVELPRASGLSPGGAAIDQLGRIVIAGTTFDRRASGSPLVTRLLPSGEPDLSFSGNGFLELDSWPGGNETDRSGLSEVAIDPRGRILVGGYHAIGGNFLLTVARIAISGHLHRRFSGDGVVTLDPERRQGSITWMGTDDVGRILFAGTAMGSTLFDVLAGRICPNGEPDRSFGGDGMIRTNVDPYQDEANDALLGGRGRLVVGGGTETGAGDMFGLLLRYLSS